jgi:hypothetical protein
MTWEPLWPDGNQSVQDNRPAGAANTTYIKTKMELDHYWGLEGNNDGHHRWMMAPKKETGGTPDNPTLATGMDGVVYLKQKISGESPDRQPVMPYYLPASSEVMELLGIRAGGVFSLSGDVFTLKYGHNVTAGSMIRSPVSTTGRYQVTFTTALPNANYGVFGGCLFDGSIRTGLFAMAVGAAVSNIKVAESFKFETLRADTTGALHNFAECWFICWGG